MQLLRGYAFPGNVRELENIIERGVMLTKGDVMLPHDIGELRPQALPPRPTVPIISPVFSTSRTHVLGLFEREFLAHQLSAFQGNVTAAARASKMTRQNFQRLMKKYGLDSSAFRS